MKKIILCLMLCVLIVFSSCSSYSLPTKVINEYNQLVAVVNKNNKLITRIEAFGGFFTYPVKDGFIYSKLSSDSTNLNNNVTREIYRYNISSKKNTHLGNIENVDFTFYECAVFHNDHIYFKTSLGDRSSPDAGIYDIDLKKNEINHIVTHGQSGLTDTLLFFENKLYYHSSFDNCVYEIDPATKNVKTILSVENSTNNKGEYIEKIAAYGENFYVLRFVAKTAKTGQVFIDTYSNKFEKLSSVEISEIISHDITGLPPREMIFHFEVKNGYVFYESFSSNTTTIFKISGDSLIKLNDSFTDNPLYLQRPIDIGKTSRYIIPYSDYESKIYSLDTENGEIKKYQVEPIGEYKSISGIFTGAVDNIIVWMHKRPSGFTMYYVELDDFKKVK